jgi:hypothetical protein
MILASCTIDVRNNDKQQPNSNTAIDSTKKVYECPMKCENKVHSDTGKCAICGMDLMLKK